MSQSPHDDWDFLSEFDLLNVNLITGGNVTSGHEPGHTHDAATPAAHASSHEVGGTDLIDHGLLTGLDDDDHSAYPLITNFEADRATIATNWADLTNGGDTILHGHDVTGLTNWPTIDYSYVSSNDAATNVSAAELETLTDTSNADALHVHTMASGITDESNYLLADGSRQLTADWDAGGFDIRAVDFKAEGNMYFNVGGPDGDVYLYFHEGGADMGARILWDDSEAVWNFGNDISIGAAETDHYLYFFDNSNPKGQSLMWDDNPGKFVLSDGIDIMGDTYFDAEVKGDRVCFDAAKDGTWSGSSYLYCNNGLLQNATYRGYIMPRNGSIVSVTGQATISGYLISGNLYFKSYIYNGILNSLKLSAQVNVSANGEWVATKTATRGTHTFSQGDALKMYISTTGSYTVGYATMIVDVYLDT